MTRTNFSLSRLEVSGRFSFLSFLVVLVLLSLLMLYSYGLYPSHDFYFHFKRLNVLMDAIGNGSFPVYIDHAAGNNYGYITKWFYSDLVLVPFALVGLATNAVFAYQFMWFSSTVLCGILMYWAVNRVYKNPYAAWISALLFTFAVYRLLDVYNRSAVGEALSFTFLPIVFVGLYEIIYGNSKKWYILTIGYSLLIFTHVLSTFLTFITTLVVLIISYKAFVNDRRRLYHLIISGVVALFVTAYFLFPMLEQMFSNSFYYQTVVKAHPNDHKQGLNWIIWGLFSGVVHPKQLFIPGVGILLTWAVALRLFVKGDKSASLKSVDTGVIIGLVYILFISSLISWDIFPLNKLVFIQLPWRLYEFVSFFFALAGGYYLSRILTDNKHRLIAAVGVVICSAFVISSSGRDFKFEGEEAKRDIYEVPTRETNNFHLYGMEYIPSKVPSIDYVNERGNRVDTKHPETVISNYGKKNGVVEFSLQTTDKETVELPLFYYKGYAWAYDNDKFPRSVAESKNGLIELSTDQSGNIRVWYEGTLVQKISPYISILSILLLCVYIFIMKRKRFV